MIEKYVKYQQVMIFLHILSRVFKEQIIKDLKEKVSRLFTLRQNFYEKFLVYRNTIVFFNSYFYQI